MLGWRLAFNDAASSSLLASVIIDRHSGEQLFSLEAEQRLSEELLLALELRAFANGSQQPQSAIEFLSDPDPQNKLRPLLQDEFLRVELSWFF